MAGLQELFDRVAAAKNTARFNRADRIFEFTGPQMEALSLSLAALKAAVSGLPGQPLPDHDNHHNAAVCPYCTENGKFRLVPVIPMPNGEETLAQGARTIILALLPDAPNGEAKRQGERFVEFLNAECAR